MRAVGTTRSALPIAATAAAPFVAEAHESGEPAEVIAERVATHCEFSACSEACQRACVAHTEVIAALIGEIAVAFVADPAPAKLQQAAEFRLPTQPDHGRLRADRIAQDAPIRAPVTEHQTVLRQSVAVNAVHVPQ